MEESAKKRRLPAWLRARATYWWKSLREGWPHLWKVVSVIALIIGGSGLAVVAFVAGEPEWAAIILLATVLLTFAEGAYRLYRGAQEDGPKGMSVRDLQKFAEAVRYGAFDTVPYGASTDRGHPRLVVDAGIVRLRLFTSPFVEGKVMLERWEAWMLVPVRNEGDAEAKAVYGRVRILEDHDLGPGLAHWIEVGWVAEPHDEHLDPEQHTAELDLPPNGRNSYLATVHKQQGNNFCTLQTKRGYWDIGLADPFVIEVELRGSNAPVQRHRFRIDPLEEDKLDLGVSVEPRP